MTAPSPSPSAGPTIPSGPALRLPEKIGYACGDVASVLYYRTVALFLPIFYTDVFGITPAAFALMLLVTRAWDVANDPMMGMIADRTQTPHGKFRPWLRWMALPWVVCGVAMFTVPDLGPTGKLIYAYVTFTLYQMVYTAVNIPYGAMLGVISPNPADRTVLASFRFYGAYTGDLVVKGSMLFLIAYLGAGDEAAGYQRTVLLYGLLSAGLFLVTFHTTRERVLPPPGQQMNIRQDLAELVRNGPWLVVCGLGVFKLLWISIRDGATLYFFKYFVTDWQVWTTPFLILTTVATLAGVACTRPITDLLGGKRRAFIMVNFAVALVSLGYFFVGPADIGLIIGIGVLSSFLGGPLLPLFWSMIADTADYGEWKNGRRITGLTFSAGTFSHKAGAALGGAAAAFVLGLSGYEANVAQSEEALGGIRLLMGVVPAAMGALTALFGLFYPIDGRMEKQMEAELAARRREQTAT
ncbi:MFS transporter [Oleiharenicola lentus]|uniref:MFS transporter n=1 Tax=Oleiharenicola lentus TaxID=2508720 RepID=UPI0013E99C19|nr:MFS transporter [Oleiharenicola lentus]